MPKSDESESPLTPIFRWAGSKRKLVPLLLECLPTFDRYIEPFAGSACLFFAIRPRRALLSDFNEELMNAYRMVRAYPVELASRVRAMPRSKVHYYQLRGKRLPKSKIDKAIRFVYLNHFCFNGVYRTDRAGMFNVPRGSKMGQMPTVAMFEECSSSLRRAALRTGDFERSLADVGVNDFVYLDPPYTKPDRRTRGEYGYGGFGQLDVRRLVNALQHIDSRKAKFLLSFTYNRELEEAIQPHWNKKSLVVRRHVAGFHEHRRSVREILLWNYEIPVSRGVGCIYR